MSASAGAAHRLGSESVPLTDAVGRVVADDVRATQPIPHYASSAMDGWAVAGTPPWRLSVADPPAIGARVADARPLAPGAARTIVTGGAIPPGSDAVLRSEDGLVSGGALRLRSGVPAPTAGTHIRPAGEEAAAGEIVIGAGTVVNPAYAALAAASGQDRLRVVALPRVRLLLTGDEVIASGLPGPGQVRDSFGPMLPSLVSQLGGAVTDVRRVADELDATVAALSDRGDAELLITTGGTGASAADHVREALADLGAEVLIPKIAVRPGSPSLLARLPDGRLVAGVAGNPLAAVVGLLLVAAPALAIWSGRHAPATVHLVAAGRIPGRPAVTSMVPYRCVADRIVPTSWSGSGMVRGLAGSDGVAIVPPEGVDGGSRLRGLALPWTGSS